MKEKIIQYEGLNPPKSQGFLIYFVQEQSIVFSGLSSAENSTSTVHASLEIVNKIVNEENIKPEDYLFYDIQTSEGYPWLGETYWNLDRLILVFAEGEVKEIRWEKILSEDDLNLDLPTILQTIKNISNHINPQKYASNF